MYRLLGGGGGAGGGGAAGAGGGGGGGGGGGCPLLRSTITLHYHLMHTHISICLLPPVRSRGAEPRLQAG